MSGRTSGRRQKGNRFEVWIKRQGEQVVIGEYADEKLAEVVQLISVMIASDNQAGIEHVSVELAEVVEWLGLRDRLEEITGLSLDVNYVFRNEQLQIEKYVRDMVDRELQVRKERAAAVRDWRETKRLQFVHCRREDYPPIPTMSAPATEEAMDLPETSGIYFVWSPDDELLYVGQSINLRNRVNLKHEKINVGDRVSWVEMPVIELYFAESFYIGIGRPILNFGNFQTQHFERAKAAESA